MNAESVSLLLFFAGLNFLAAGAGARLGGLDRDDPWYAALRRPVGMLPDATYGRIWTWLHLTLAGAAWELWQQRGYVAANAALTDYGVVLALLLLWPVLLWRQRRLRAAFLTATLLWLVLFLAAISAASISWLAFWLLTPLVLWTAYLARLNFFLWKMNQPATALPTDPLPSLSPAPAAEPPALPPPAE